MSLRIDVTNIMIIDKNNTTLTGININSIKVFALNISLHKGSFSITHHHFSHRSKANTGAAAISIHINPSLTTFTTTRSSSDIAYITVIPAFNNIVMSADPPLFIVL